MKNRKSNRKVDARLARACFRAARKQKRKLWGMMLVGEHLRRKRKARKERVKKLTHLHD